MVKEIRNSDVESWKKMHEEGMSYKEIADKAGYCPDTVFRHVTGKSYHKCVSTRKKPVAITDEKVEDMKIYRELGLSNKQIAIEMGLSVVTVQRHLGNQKDGHRADYGSIVAHTTGESFVPKGYDLHKLKEEKKLEKEQTKVDIIKTEEIPKDVPSSLKIASFQLVLNGEECRYTIENGQVRIERLGEILDIPIRMIGKLAGELKSLEEVAQGSLFSIDVG
jgi:DNA-binding CsgD family transcriptional regulator